ncbi:hypothetical protein CUMW_266280 [Citrus unshiu]|uniref:Uncharacterized protein n=1 Tax=Citrus unshiu TaxID=55188 RepID=A0A2H5QVV0_CITUN|nr:hypothetical protein CUMW_266280 [Citrus unshiu]
MKKEASVLFTLKDKMYVEGFPSGSPVAFANMVLQNDIDLLNPPVELEKKKYKLKHLIQSPNSFFMNHYFQPLSNCRGLWQLPVRSTAAHWWTCQTH